MDINAPQPFTYYLDSPRPNEEVSKPFVLIRGWITSSARIANPKIRNLSGTLTYTVTSVPRPDVTSAFPNLHVFGFQNYLSITDVSPEESWLLEFCIEGKEYSFPLIFSISVEAARIFLTQKQEKLGKIKSILKCIECESEQLKLLNQNFSNSVLRCRRCGSKFKFNKIIYNFLTNSLSDYANVKPTANVSEHGYDSIAINIINQFKDGLILDNGCGLRNVYYPNVVNFEIVDYPTTDVLGIGEKLPFKSNVFDAVFSFAVLEHVKNPFECASEIVRVLKPGGILYAIVPFLQPFHGYPDHYYNMTSSGLKNLFSKKLQIIECTVPPGGLPIWCLSWFLNSYIRGLPEPAAAEFKKMRVSQLLSYPPECLEKDFVKQLSTEANEELACTNSLIAKKPENQFQSNQPRQEQLHYPVQSNRTALERLLSQLQYAQAELLRAKAVISTMQTGKFWKLKEIWFKFKTLMYKK